MSEIIKPETLTKMASDFESLAANATRGDRVSGMPASLFFRRAAQILRILAEQQPRRVVPQGVRDALEAATKYRQRWDKIGDRYGRQRAARGVIDKLEAQLLQMNKVTHALVAAVSLEELAEEMFALTSNPDLMLTDQERATYLLASEMLTEKASAIRLDVPLINVTAS